APCTVHRARRTFVFYFAQLYGAQPRSARGKRGVGQAGLAVHPGPFEDHPVEKFPGRPEMMPCVISLACPPALARRHRCISRDFGQVLIERGVRKMIERVFEFPDRSIDFDRLMYFPRTVPPFIPPEKPKHPIAADPPKTQA